MSRRVKADHRRLWTVPPIQKDLTGLRVKLNQRQLRGGRRVILRVREDRFDVAIARDDVVVDGRGIEHRLVCHSEQRHHRERIGKKLRRERVKPPLYLGSAR
jgi:hypothetical protein